MYPEAFMSFKAELRHVGDVAILDLAGRLTIGESAGALRSQVKELVHQGEKKVLLNLKDVSYVDSAGLGEMIAAFASVTNAGGQIKLLHTQAKIHDLLQVTKLITVFADYSDEAQAIQSFKQQASAKG
jgi:anti-sigma B factor antagonist